MKDLTDYFVGKKITVMGLGLLGRGVGDAAYLAEMGAEVTVTDLKSEAELSSSVTQLQPYKNIRFVLGEHCEEDFREVDFVLVAAGVPLASPYLEVAKQAGVPLRQSAAWFAELSEVPVIGVTGTRGKSTVTHMIHHCLSVITGEEVLLGGTIRGVSNLQLLRRVKEESLAVMELDSWQLQGWGWQNTSPQVAVFTNFMEDHLNYYQTGASTKEAGMAAYFADKAQIFLHQTEAGVLVTTPEVFSRIKALPDFTLGQEVVLADKSIVDEDALLAMPGEHNRLNAALAVETLRALSLEEVDIWPALASFAGVEGRLQLLATVDNVRYYNDNNATTPAATVAALKALDLGNKNIILIAGGADKGLDLEELAEAIKAHCKQVIVTPGNGTDRLLAAGVEAERADDVSAALAAAMAAASAADIILFSPAFSSFAQYANEYERNDEFVSLVRSYENNSNSQIT